MGPAIEKTAVEERVRSEFEAALCNLENASEEEKPVAESRLNRAVRALYDLVGHGKMPRNWRALNTAE